MHLHLRLTSYRLVSLLASMTLNLHAASWVNLLEPAHGGLAGSSSDITTDATGNVFAVGSTTQTPDGSMRALALGSGDRGTTWEVLDAYAEAGFNYAHYRAVASDPTTGRLFAGGNLNHLLPDGTWQFGTLWLVREWNPETGLWTTVDDAADLASDIGQASCADLLVTPGGDVYATGGGDLGLVVRKRTAGADSFTTVHADRTGQSPGAGWDLTFDANHGLFAVGDANGSWTVRRSPTGEAGSWAMVNTFKTSEWTSSSATAVATTPAGALHVAGWAYSSKNRKYHWMVRSSFDGGATWSISDTYSYGGSNANVSAIAVDAAGHLFVGGQVSDSAGKLWWLVRQGVPGTKRVKQGGQWVTVPTVTWSNSDLYRLAAGQPARVNGLTVDPDGTVLASGRAADAAGANSWIVRKLAP